jgi:hypothetical protein
VQKAPKESKSHGADKGPKKESKSDKKNDSKHPAGSAAFDHDHAAEPKSQLGSRGDGVKDLEPLPTPEVAPKSVRNPKPLPANNTPEQRNRPLRALCRAAPLPPVWHNVGHPWEA